MKIAVVRGAFANPFEMQSYEELAKAKNIEIQLITSKHPLNSSINLSYTQFPDEYYRFSKKHKVAPCGLFVCVGNIAFHPFIKRPAMIPLKYPR